MPMKRLHTNLTRFKLRRSENLMQSGQFSQKNNGVFIQVPVWHRTYSALWDIKEICWRGDTGLSVIIMMCCLAMAIIRTRIYLSRFFRRLRTHFNKNLLKEILFLPLNPKCKRLLKLNWQKLRVHGIRTSREELSLILKMEKFTQWGYFPILIRIRSRRRRIPKYFQIQWLKTCMKWVQSSNRLRCLSVSIGKWSLQRQHIMMQAFLN